MILCSTLLPASSLAILLASAVTLPASTAGCERGFSTQNRLKTKLRNRLLEGKLDTLMRLSIEGEPLNEFDFASALAVWKSAKSRRMFGQNPASRHS